MKSVAAVLLLVSLPVVSTAEDLDRAMARIRPQAIEAHMRFLSDDLLEGRDTGARGYEIAARYVATQFQLLGLEPAGGDGSFFQRFDLRRVWQVEKDCSLTLIGGDGERELVFARDFLMWGDPVREWGEIEAPLVFVGYGVRAPDQGYDDYDGVDVRGKIVVTLEGAPPWFPHDERAFYSSGHHKRSVAVAEGAVGSISFYTPQRAKQRPWERTVELSSLPSMRTLGPDGEPLKVYPELQVRAFLSPAGARTLFAGSPESLDRVLETAETERPGSFDLPARCRMTRGSRHQRVRSCNVAGLLRGSDPDRRDEVLVYTAHLDHIGVAAAVDGDSVYNGAYDNAAGIAVLLEAARAFASLESAPRRSILFLAVTGEERGLLGSRYFVANPTVPLEGIVGSINLDMPLMLHPLHDVIAFGAEHSTFEPIVERAVGRLGLELSPDPMPDEVLFIRSDQYSFVEKGIPAIFLVCGLQTGDSGGDGEAMFQEWLRTVYHTRRDEMTEDMDFEAGVRFAQANFTIGYEIANGEQVPRWNPGDFFGDRFSPAATD